MTVWAQFIPNRSASPHGWGGQLSPRGILKVNGSELDRQRQHAHVLLDLLPADKLTAVRALLEVLVEPLSRSLATAPFEEEELSPETIAALDRARTSLDRGEGIAHDELIREFGVAR